MGVLTRITTAIAFTGAMTTGVFAQDEAVLTAADRANQFTEVTTVGISLSLGDVIGLALETSFAQATACDIDDAFSISRTLIDRKISDIDALFDQAHEAVIAAGYPDYPKLYGDLYLAAEQSLTDRGGSPFPNDVVREMKIIESKNDDFSDVDAQESIYHSAVDQWLIDNSIFSILFRYEC